MDKLECLKESKKRIRAMSLGDAVTNVCAGDTNPKRHAYFVELVTRSRKNRYGITHTECWARCTDKKGKFWNTDIKVIYPGHLSYEKSCEIFRPIWEMEYGKKQAINTPKE